ncbi:MAG: exo-alpha-sialidase [Caldilineaceae bacterium]|nr:exo-alpha-sialidase [Caldilineaceae bacterium]
MLRLCILFLAGLSLCSNVVSAQSNATPIDCYGEGFYVGQEMILVIRDNSLHRLDDDGWQVLPYPDGWPSDARWPQVQVTSDGAIYLYVYSFESQSIVDDDPNAERGRIYRSNDKGETWTLTGYDPATVNTGPRRVYATPAQDRLLFTYSVHGIYYSEDAGATWQEADMEYLNYPYTDEVQSLSISPAFVEDGIAMATVVGEYLPPGPVPEMAPFVMKTTDWGATWSYEPTGLDGIDTAPLQADTVALSPQFGEDQTIFMVSIVGLIKSTDGGVTWELLYESTQWGRGLLPDTIAFSPDYAADQTVLIDNKYLSRDGGQTLTRLANPKPRTYAVGIRRQGPFSPPEPASISPGENRYYLPLVRLDVYPLEIWAVYETRIDGVTGCYLFRSRDDGGSWELININGE